MPENPRIEELRRRVRIDRASIAFAALAEELRRLGRYDEAIETCRTGLQRHPAYLSARVTLARALLDAGQAEPARLELRAVLRVAPENLAAIRALVEMQQPRPQAVISLPQDGDPWPGETAAAATIARLERLLGAIQNARAAIS
jgi:tetratricopeptide (TPR) repeat protein